MSELAKLGAMSTADDVLTDYLDRFHPRTARERADVEAVRALATGARAWRRDTPLHVTASALIVHPPTERVLLRWHERQHAWLQVGGHADPGEVDPLAIARREGAEETGLDDLEPWPAPAIQHIVLVDVPANSREPAHRHADIRFFLATGQPERARPENEGALVQWLRPADAAALTTEDNVRETIVRAAALFGG
jgi:8-oxo-dGTP pyrophosphatase MutT (NUDIX family)